MFSKAVIVIWMRRNKLSVWTPKSTEVTEWVVPDTIVREVEVINRDELYGLIKGWIKEWVFSSSEIVWILDAEVCFERILSETTQATWDSETVKFLDEVPFEKVASRVYATNEGRLVVGLNQEWMEAYEHGFALLGYGTKAEVPVSRLGWLKSKELTKETYGEVVKRVGELVKERVLNSDEGMGESVVEPNKVKTETNGQTRSILPWLLVVLLGLGGVLTFLLLRR